MALSDTAQQLLDALNDPETGDADDHVMALPIPYGLTAGERASEISRHQAIVDELRAAGWPVEVHLRRIETGEVLAFGFTPGAPRPSTSA